MADWKELPDTLDPSMRQLVAGMRRLKDRSRLSLAAIAMRTAYSKSSWERYLNGVKLPPRQAVEGLCGMVGANPARLLALWELAEAAWSGRGREPQAAAAGARTPAARSAATSSPAAGAPAEPAASRPAPAAPGPEPAPPVPPDPGPATPPTAPGDATPARTRAPAGSPAHAPSEAQAPPQAEPQPQPQPEPPAPARKAVWWPLPHRVLVPLVAVAAAAAAAGIVLGVRGTGDRPTDQPPAAGVAQDAVTATKGQDTKCHGERCTGHDPKAMGCGGDAWTAAESRVGQAYVEVRYSNACRAAWARIQWGAVGDRVQIATDDGSPQRGLIHYDADAYSPMVGALTPQQVRACATLTSGRQGCTLHGGDRHLEEPPPWPGPGASAPPSSAAPSSAPPSSAASVHHR
jgi:Protein of unknown function (DUF2690)/Helix-turn-helix domain